jgi:hypothetical protein
MCPKRGARVFFKDGNAQKKGPGDRRPAIGGPELAGGEWALVGRGTGPD